MFQALLLEALKDKFKNWETGRKDGVSSALSENASVYFTIGHGILNETYFPSPDNIVLHSIRFFINNKIDESELTYKVQLKDLFAPTYIVKTRFKNLTIEKDFAQNIHSSTLLLRYIFSETISGSFKIYPFLESVVKKSKRNIIIKSKSAFINISLDIDFTFEQVEDFIIIYVSNIKAANLALSFGQTIEETIKVRHSKFEKVQEDFANQWANYISSLNIGSTDPLFLRSIINIKSMEDRLHKGAVVASIAFPWGDKLPLTERNGYHLIWVRDLFFISIAMYLAGDKNFAHNSLDYMVKYLQREDGSFKQNSTINGEERWHSTQMDQVAFPIILAYVLKRFDLIKSLRKSSDYIFKNGPYSEQERWEEIGGFSPYAISLQALALNLFGKMKNVLKENGDKYLEKADEFKNLIDISTLTKSGIFAKSYYVRVSKGDPDTNRRLMNLNGIDFAPKEMVSADFLYTVFTGIFNPNKKEILNTVNVIDKTIRVETPKGPSFYRYNNDIYGFDNPENPKGRLWVLLTGERGIFELMRGNYSEKYLKAMKDFATSTYLLPEQVFEDGTPTESATPLAWSHATYIILHKLINYPEIMNKVNYHSFK